MKDYYAILGISRQATQEEIKSAFRAKARSTHPDANPDDPLAEARFREVAEAYEVLGDPSRRHAYDRGDRLDLSGLFAHFGDFDDLLRSMFGGSGFAPNRGSGLRARDLLVRTEISLGEAAFGTNREVEYQASVRCEECEGSGAAPGSLRRRCLTCGGNGSVAVSRGTLFGQMMSVITCTNCRGSGEVVENPCSSCRGQRFVQGLRKLSVEVPPGVDSGTRLRLRSHGAAGEDGTGDLLVEVLVGSDPNFERDGDDLVLRVEIGMAEAALGTQLSITGISGEPISLSVPAGTQPMARLRVAGEGMGRLGRRGRGDLIVEIKVVIPKRLRAEEEALLREFSELRGERPLAPRRSRRHR